MALFRKNKGESPQPKSSTPPAWAGKPSGRPPLTPVEPTEVPPVVTEEVPEEVIEAPATPEVVPPSVETPEAAASLEVEEQVAEEVTESSLEEPEEVISTLDSSPEAVEPGLDQESEGEKAPEADVPKTPSKKEKKKSSKTEKPEKEFKANSKTVRELPRVMAIANQKGGVGKTTTTISLGAALAELGYRVLVIDLDPQGNATTGLGIERSNFEHSMYDVIMHEHPLEDCVEPTSVKNLFVAPATLDLSGVDIELVSAFSRESRLKRAIDLIIDDFDFIMIDTPPSLGLITINALTAAKEVLVPIQCEYFALEGLSQLQKTLQLVASNLNPDLELSTIVLTMFDSRTNLATDVANDVREHFPEQVCESVIPRTVRLSEAPSFGQPITVFDPRSTGAESYRKLAREVSNGAPKRAG